MAVLNIKLYPEEVLAKPTVPVDVLDGEVCKLLDDLVETMFAQKGVGVAANQVGAHLRVFVLDADTENRGEKILKIVNPRIVSRTGEVVWREGCLSLPGLELDIRRAERVVVEGLDPNGEPVRIEGDGLLAVALQHELDHLEGRVILDRVSALKRNFYKRKIQKHGYPVDMGGEHEKESRDL